MDDIERGRRVAASGLEQLTDLEAALVNVTGRE